MTKRNRRNFTDEFKNQVVQLHLNGKPKAELIKEYELTLSSLNRWIKQHQASGSFKEKITGAKKKMSLSDFERKTSSLRWKMIF